MPHARLHGINIHYEEHGAHYGVPILLTHAFAATLEMWRPQFDALTDYRVIAWDMRGLEGLGRGPEIDATREYQRSASGLAMAARGILTQRDANVMEHLEEIDVPTLIILGADDARYKAGGDYMASKIPNAHKVVIEGAAHAVNLYQPE